LSVLDQSKVFHLELVLKQLMSFTAIFGQFIFSMIESVFGQFKQN